MSFLRPQIEKTTRTVGDEYFVCSDCLSTIANGEDHPKEKSMCDANLAIGDSENDEEFSSSDCDCCGSSLAGSRHQCWDVDNSESEDCYRWRLSAPGFLDCTDWHECDSLITAIQLRTFFPGTKCPKCM